jgi:hypothetical protein
MTNGPQVTFVTALFVPPGGSYRSVEKYKEHFQQLAATGVPISLFLDPALREYGEQLERECLNVRVIDWLVPDTSFLDGVEPEAITLPTKRNEKKDTVDYMSVQLMKIPLCSRAAAAAHAAHASPFVAWIDFGIFHMFKDHARVAELLRDLAWSADLAAKLPRDRILSPGCWDAGTYPIWTSICWRHCGSFLLGARELFAPAAEAQAELVRANLPRLTWEVNYWNELERLFHVYKADHNDTILTGLLSGLV